MACEGMLIDGSEDPCQESLPDLSTGNVHPKVTAKKTFFDLHPKRRSRSDEVSNRHPRIQWSAGSTEIGSSHRTTTTYSDYLAPDTMKPILQPDPPTPEPISISLASRPDLPPVPDTWGPLDVEPTRPEEIQHLFDPCPLIDRPEVLQESEKPKKKFLNKFRKRSKSAAVDSVVIRIPDDNQPDTIRPEEEFRLLNESYIRDGIIQPESLRKHDYWAASKSGLASPPKSRDKHVKLDLTPHSRDSRDQENVTSGSADQEVIDKNGKMSPESSFDVTRGSLDLNRNSEEPGSPLPARRSCEPVNIKNLRKLRDSDAEPSPSGSGQQQNRDSLDSKTTMFATRTPRISIDDNEAQEMEVTNLKIQESLPGMTKNSNSKDDIFKIDNPFSDFSLQTIKPRNLLNKRTPELIMKKIPQHRDSSIPGTSKAAYATNSIRPKVSHTENHGERSREESQSTLSGLKKSSFLDKAKSPQRSLDATAKRVTRKNVVETRKNHCEINETLGTNLFSAIVRQIVTEHFGMSYVLLETEEVDSDDGKIFGHYNPKFESMLKLLMENIVNPTFKVILENHLSNLLPNFGKSFCEVTPVSRNYMLDDIANFLKTSCPKAVNDVLNVSDKFEINIDGVDNDNGTDLLSAPHHDRSESILSPLALSKSVQSNEIIENIIDHVINVAFSQDLIPEVLFLSLSPTLTLTPNRRNFEGWCSKARFYSRQHVYRSYSVNLLDFLGEFNLYNIFDTDKPRNFEIMPALIIDNMARSLRLTHVWKNDVS